MLVHEVMEGAIERVGDFMFARPPGAALAFRLPDHVEIFFEKDGTRSLSGPIGVTLRNGALVNAYLIHGRWIQQELATRRHGPG